MGKSITYKINFLIILAILVVALPSFVFLIILMNRITNRTETLLVQSVKQEISELSRLTMEMAAIANDISTKMLKANLNTANEILKRKGEVTISGTESISVTNQFTKESFVANVPRVSLGGVVIPIITTFDQPAPIVDEVTKLTGATATLFIRLNQNGDMLRVATTVKTKDGKRAVKTFIPAINPDGEKNPVVTKILSGESYFGRAFVVDQWYLTAYSPIKSKSGEIIGMLYVGIPQEEIVGKLRKVIYSIKIGETGYISVLQGSGTEKGTYLISKDGKRDGENIWDSKDANGKLFIQEMINETTKKPGEILFFKYDWKNIGETKPRRKIVARVYYKDWDWVIGASGYEDEMFAVPNEIISSFKTMLIWMTVLVVLAIIVAFVIASQNSKRIAKPVLLAAQIADAIGDGDIEKANSLLEEGKR